jgi:2-polyprenyl-3-methyl-5-hydroxy-6-metoxy-1,4-benzoquinol methylase
MGKEAATSDVVTKCLICASPEHDLFLKVPNRFQAEQRFNLIRCTQCGFVFLSPRPDEQEITTFYEEEDYQPHQKNATSLTERIYQSVRTWNNKYKRRLLEKYIPQGSILDYGCGTGEFLLEMQNAGWKTFGLEPAEKAANVAREYGIPLFDSLKQVETSVEVITLWHVLEHIHHPQVLLKSLKDLLSPNGYLIIAVPNRLSWDAQIFKSNWVAFDAPRHLYHFRPQDMQSLLHSIGFTMIDYKGLHFDPWYNSLLSVALETQHKNSLQKLISFSKGLSTAILSSIQGFLFQKKNSSVIYIVRKRSDEIR